MPKTIRAALVGALLALFSAPAFAQTQPIPSGLTPDGRYVNSTPVAPCIAPSGGAAGTCKPVADDHPFPVGSVDGANATVGAQADSVCPFDTSTCSLIALIKRTNANVSTLAATQPALGQSTKSGSVPVVLPTDGGTATNSGPISISTATTTKVVAASGSKATLVSHFDFIAAGSDNVTWEYGTGTNCGTGTTALTGAYNLAANGGISVGNGNGVIMFVPASQDLCLVTSQAVQLSGLVSYAQF